MDAAARVMRLMLIPPHQLRHIRISDEGLMRSARDGDVTALLNAGELSKTDDGMIIFPYDAIHVDFMLKAA